MNESVVDGLIAGMNFAVAAASAGDPGTGFLLEDGTSFVLMEDGTSFLLQE